MRKIAHIINPHIVDQDSDLYTAQPITFETMKIAKDYVNGQVDVSLYSAQYAEDRVFIPDSFHLTRDLERSVLDVCTFKKKRKLPLLKDILDRLYEVADADYLIYTNVDIALMPYFYEAVNSTIDAGYDAFVINRRMIPEEYVSIEQIPLMFSQIGEKHPGYDCFIFKKSLYPKFQLGNACIGANLIGRVLIVNLICHAKKFTVIADQHLTFHIGDDKKWQNSIYHDYDDNNRTILHQILLENKSNGHFDGKPLLEDFLQEIESPIQPPVPSPLEYRLRRLSLLEGRIKASLRRIIMKAAKRT
jgi:hypothetical protein